MTRRQASSTRRGSGSFPFSGVFNSKSKSSPLFSICLVLLGAVFLIVYAFGGSGLFGGQKDVVSRLEVVFPKENKLFRLQGRLLPQSVVLKSLTTAAAAASDELTERV